MSTAHQKINISKKAFVFFNCLLLSSLLWVLTTMNQLHTDKICFPVKYTGIPAHMTPINKLPESIEIKIQASGYRLIMNRMQKKWTGKNVVINLEHELNKKNKSLLGISLQSKRNEISTQLGKQITILSIEPDSLHIQFALKAFRKVPVVVKSELQFQPGYGLSAPVIISTDSIEITGSLADIQKTDTIFTFTVQESQINKSINRIVGLDFPVGIQSRHTDVSVIFPVEQLSEKKLTCDVEVISENSGNKIELLQTQVSVKILVPNSLYHQVSAADIRLGVYSREVSATRPKLIVRVLNKPTFVQVLDITPQTVDYLIKSK